MQILYSEPHRGRRQGLVCSHNLRKAPSFGDKEIQVLDEIGFVRVA